MNKRLFKKKKKNTHFKLYLKSRITSRSYVLKLFKRLAMMEWLGLKAYNASVRSLWA